jgi:IS605 OrfB family transposase
MNRTFCQILNLSNSECEELHLLMEQCAEIWQEHANWFFENKKGKHEAQKALYYPTREKFPNVPSSIILAVKDTAYEASKRLKFKKIPQKKNFTLRYNKNTISLRGNLLTFSSLGKRIRTIINFPDFFKNKLEWKFTGAQLVFLKKKKKFQIHLNFKKEEPEKRQNGTIVGIDRGLYNLVTTSTGEKFSGSKIRERQRKNLHLSKQLKSQGNKSAKRKLKQIAGKEKRFSRDVNHCITKKLAANSDVKMYILEDLTGIRTKRRGKKMNKWLGSWSFFQLENFLKYKCEEAGIWVEKICPKYTSQTCPECGSISRKNRKKGLFKCQDCGHKNCADKNAAINIREKYIFSQHQTVEQAFVNMPNVSVLSGLNLNLQDQAQAPEFIRG